ncbi:hypothetical protein [Streptomyces sp. Tue6028]|uniref:hypothetical protein n=1 Tax=Streptomyces sp. Tue6028 TaxID=2036037 RepID=UPI003EB96211
MKGLDTNASSILRVSPDRRYGWHDADAIGVGKRRFGYTALEPATCPPPCAGVLSIQEKLMARTLFPARCVVHGSSWLHRPSLADAVVIVVIAVLACLLSVHGVELPSVLAVLGGAGLVAAGTLTAIGGGDRSLHRAVVRAANAISAL